MKTQSKDVERDEVPTRRVNSWEELQKELFKDWWGDGINRYRTKRLFRGLSDRDYQLITSFQRMGKRMEAGTKRDQYFTNIEPLMLRNFQKYARLDTEKRNTVWHLLTIAQHHGLPTRLLDWTNSLFVALHFVTRNPEHYDKDGLVWAVNFLEVHKQLPPKLKSGPARGAKTFSVDELYKVVPTLQDLDRIKKPCLIFFEPPSIDERIVNQYSLSSVMPRATEIPEAWLRSHPELCERIIIPAGLKRYIRDALDQANLTERVFFPGLDGLSEWLVRYYGRQLDGKRRQKNPDSELLYQGEHLSFYGGKGCWEYVCRARTTHGVAIVALTNEGRLLLVQQPRVPLGKNVIELPAGLVDGASDTNVIMAAKRELFEETGFLCSTEPTLLYKGAALPGTTNEINAFCLAEKVRFSGPKSYFVLEEGGVRRHKRKRGVSNEGENITVYEVPIGYVGEWLEKQIQTGNVVDIKVHAALSFLNSGDRALSDT